MSDIKLGALFSDISEKVLIIPILTDENWSPNVP